MESTDVRAKPTGARARPSAMYQARGRKRIASWGRSAMQEQDHGAAAYEWLPSTKGTLIYTPTRSQASTEDALVSDTDSMGTQQYRCYTASQP